MKAWSEGVHTPSINTEGDTLSTKTIKRSALTKAVTLFALVGMGIIAHPATATFAAPESATDDTPATTADNGNRITASEPGASTATGGIKVTGTTVNGNYGDKFSVNATLNIKVTYEGDKVEKGATFSVGLGDGLQVPNGFNSVDLKATALDGSEKTIGKCAASGGAFTCTVTENVAEVLGGNGSIKNGFVKLQATLNKSSIGKKTTSVVVDGTKYTIDLGKGVVGEPVTKGDNKFCWSDGKTAEGLYQFGCWIQAQAKPGQTITITETRDDATFKGGIQVTPADNGDWANPIDWNNVGVAKPKVTKSADGKSATFTIPSELSGDHMARIRVAVTTSEKTMVNKATVNGQEVTTTATWKAKGSSGAETDEDAKPVEPAPTPDPTPAPDPKPTPEPTPEPSEPPAPTPEPSTPPVTPDPEPETPAPTPDPTPETPKPDPKPEPTPEAPKPDPKPTPEQPTPDPKPTPDTPPVTPDPEPSVPPVTPDPEPSTPPVTPDPKPSEPPVTPEPSTPPAPTPEPKPSEPTTPVTPNTPSTPDTPPVTPKAPTPSAPASNGGGTLAKTGADAGLIAGAGALAVAGGALLVARRRQNKN